MYFPARPTSVSEGKFRPQPATKRLAVVDPDIIQDVNGPKFFEQEKKIRCELEGETGRT
jgi:hypothetical protein